MEKAKRIWKSKNYSADEYAAFYDKFNFNGKIAGIEITAFGDYNLFVNGTLASFGQVADYADYKIYDAIDLTPYLVKGENSIVIEAWYQGLDCFTGIDLGAGIIYEVKVDGKVAVFSEKGKKCSDLKYKEHKKKKITAQLGYSFNYDQNVVPAFYSSEEIDGDYHLAKRENKRTFIGETLKAEKIKDNLYDLGKETSGFLYFCGKIEKGKTLTVAYGEHIADGKVRDKIADRNFTVEITGNGEETEKTFSFRRLGARYLQIYCNGQYSLKEIGIKEVCYPFTVKPYKAKNALRQKIYDTSVRTLTLCAHERYEDCPWREQGTYIMDGRNQMLCGYYAFDNPEMQRSALKLMMHGQEKSGLFGICFPCRYDFTIPSFSLTYPTAYLEYLTETGDKSFITEALTTIEKMLDFFKKGMIDGLYKTISSPNLWHFYEWSGDLDGNFFSEDPALKNRSDFDSLINAFYSIALQKTSEIYAIAGDNVRAENLKKQAENINENIRKVFITEKGVFKTYATKNDYSVLANALCVLSGAAKKEEYSAIAQFLVNPPENAVKNTLSMNIFRFDALLKIDEKYADFILSEIERVYGIMLKAGATSFWETEKGESDFDGAGSLCHGWSAIPIYYFNKLNG